MSFASVWRVKTFPPQLRSYSTMCKVHIFLYGPIPKPSKVSLLVFFASILWKKSWKISHLSLFLASLFLFSNALFQLVICFIHLPSCHWITQLLWNTFLFPPDSDIRGYHWTFTLWTKIPFTLKFSENIYFLKREWNFINSSNAFTLQHHEFHWPTFSRKRYRRAWFAVSRLPHNMFIENSISIYF